MQRRTNVNRKQHRDGGRRAAGGEEGYLALELRADEEDEVRAAAAAGGGWEGDKKAGLFIFPRP
jgi:hypothetical protein